MAHVVSSEHGVLCAQAAEGEALRDAFGFVGSFRVQCPGTRAAAGKRCCVFLGRSAQRVWCEEDTRSFAVSDLITHCVTDWRLATASPRVSLPLRHRLLHLRHHVHCVRHRLRRSSRVGVRSPTAAPTARHRNTQHPPRRPPRRRFGLRRPLYRRLLHLCDITHRVGSCCMDSMGHG